MPIAPAVTHETLHRLRARLAPHFAGELRDDRLTRAIYATDASIYEIAPDLVACPRSVDDIRAAVGACAETGVAITPRGAGTGLTGGAVNRGVQLDCSRHLRRILNIDHERRVAVVEPGVVLDHLNAALAPHGLQFAPDVATSSRATIGGMIANNSCGAHSILYGRTVDHVAALDVVLSAGSMACWGAESSQRTSPDNRLARNCDAVLRATIVTHGDEIARRFPKVLRSNAGYGLDRLRVDNGRINTEAVICGSEGTLGIIARATLRLTPLPNCRGLLLVHFASLLDSLAAVPAILEHRPAAIELIDDLILSAARGNAALSGDGDIIGRTPAAVLIVELYDDDSDSLLDRLRKLERELMATGVGTAHRIETDAVRQAAVWNLRKAGLGLLMSRPGDCQPYAFVEDTAVDPSRLRDYIDRFAGILAEERVEQAGYYAHASVGCLHVRPVLNLKDRGDVARMRRIADRVSALAMEFGGTMTGEHGDGLLRSEWIEQLYGPRIIGAFREIKRTFDPAGILNPGKIVDTPAMTEHLRYGAGFAPGRDARDRCTLDFSAHDGMLGLAQMCSGVGQCRQTGVGMMCPSYEATGDELHTTRARANALRMALSNRSLLTGLDDAALGDVMDLCISCKACKSECPTGVDMARLKAEWQHREHLRNGAPLRSRIIARTSELARIASRAPRLANAVMQSALARQLADRWLRLDRRIPPPVLATQTFRAWFDNCADTREQAGTTASKTVVYFVDTWTDLFTPQVGRAAVRVLEALGFRVIVPPPVCCGRPAISKGMLDVARGQLEHLDLTLAALGGDSPIVGTEPSCLLTLTDEFPQLVRTDSAARIARRALLIESFVLRELTARGDAERSLFAPAANPSIRYHGHCHQKAIPSTRDTLALLRRIAPDASEIDSGCCGMAGAFGHEREHYDVARSIGSQRLFPAVRDRGPAAIAVSGFSCAQQIAHHTDAQPRHVIEFVADALLTDDAGIC